MEMKRIARNPLADQSICGSSSSESEGLHRPIKKQRHKVKIPVKPTKPYEEEYSNTPPRRHFCKVCNKEFSCGKAFGGHVRIHSMEYKRKTKTMNKMVMKKKKKNMKGMVKEMVKKEGDLMIRADVEEVGEIKCCLCGKVFQTKHSLFGHMRRHPDRSWKGIRPPAPDNKISSCSSDLDDDDDVLVDDDDDDVMSSSVMDVQEAAYCLMMLSCSGSKNRCARSLGFGVEPCGDMEKAKSEVRDPYLYEGKGKEKVLDDDELKSVDEISSSKNKGLMVDMKIKMKIEVTMNSTRDHHLQDRAQVRGNGDKKLLGFDLNQPYAGEEEDDEW